MALGDDGGTKPGAKVFREFVELRVAVNLDGFLGGIANHVAVVAPSQMIFQFSLCALINDAVEVVGQLAQEIQYTSLVGVSGFGFFFAIRGLAF